MDKSFCTNARSAQFILHLPAIALMFVIGVKELLQESAKRGESDIFLGSAFVVIGLLLIVHLIYASTLRVIIDEHSIVRTWRFGSATVSMDKINGLRWVSSRGTFSLDILYGDKKRVTLSALQLCNEDLFEIQRCVLIANGLEGEPLCPKFDPRFAVRPSYIDVAEMRKRKRGNAPADQGIVNPIA